MNLLPGDYVILLLALGTSLLGLFRGFSGTLAFFTGIGGAGLFVSLGWPLSAEWIGEFWRRILVVGGAAIVVFGLVRLVIKKLVGGLLQQPSDAVFGFLTGLVFAVLGVVGWALSGLYLEYSAIATMVVGYLR